MSDRSVLMAPYLKRYEVWEQLAQGLEAVWVSTGITDSIEQLKWLRSPINVTDIVTDVDGRLVPLASVPSQDRTSLVLTADLLGFRFYETSLLDTDDYLKLCRHLAEYYARDKGTPLWSDFLGWCLNTHFRVLKTWTQDYQTFLTDGDPAIGTSIDNGGTWYPTTHVILEYDMSHFQGIPASQIVEFFNYFANVNLVLWMTQLSGTEKLSLECAAVGSIEFIYPGSI